MSSAGMRQLWAAMSDEQRERFVTMVQEAVPNIVKMMETYQRAGIEAAERHANWSAE